MSSLRHGIALRSERRLKQGAVVLLSGVIVFAVQWATADDSEFAKRPYVGLGLGVNELDPEAQCPCVTVGDSTDAGFVLTGGYDLSRHFSIDGYYNYAGAAGIDFLGDRVGELDYRMAGLSGIGYVFNSQGSEGLDRREGLSLFLRLGAGFMQNDSSLDFDRDHTAHVMAGLGAEYGWQNGLALRAEVNSYDTDAQTLSVSLLKRFGTVPRKAAPAVVPLTPVAPDPIEPETVIEMADSTVVNFAFAADELSATAVQKLITLAAQLQQNPEVSLALEGHTDDIDTESYNQRLSERRAQAVKAWLVESGVEQDRLSIAGFGETRPIASNTTTEGRARNRRVEIRVQ